MMCQDCGKREATHLVFNIDDLAFFWVCEECIKEEDRAYSIKELKKDICD